MLISKQLIIENLIVKKYIKGQNYWKKKNTSCDKYWSGNFSKYLELTTGLKHIFEDKLLNHTFYKVLSQFLKDT